MESEAKLFFTLFLEDTSLRSVEKWTIYYPDGKIENHLDNKHKDISDKPEQAFGMILIVRGIKVNKLIIVNRVGRGQDISPETSRLSRVSCRSCFCQNLTPWVLVV